MCQVTPFTLPCCRRIYVSIARLPSCPETWPKAKCPPELCIQLRGYYASGAEHKPVGICWRCKAILQDKLGAERERLRPGIDKAFVVPGLVELTPSDRRRLAEAAGECWFCGTRGCDMCAGKKTTLGTQRRLVMTAKRQADRNRRATYKRLKTEGDMVLDQTSLSPFFQSRAEQGFQLSYGSHAGPSHYASSSPPTPMPGIRQMEPQYYSSSINLSLLDWLPDHESSGLSTTVADQGTTSFSSLMAEQEDSGFAGLLPREGVMTGKVTGSTNKPEQEVLPAAEQGLGVASIFDRVS